MGKKFQDLDPSDKQRLLECELRVVEITADRNEVRDLFIRLQAGTPLTAHEKRDAWPGDFTNFVIQHAGKPSHKLSNPKPFFAIFRKTSAKRLSIADSDHYVDGLAETRKFFAGLAMTIMLRERAEVDFVDLKGKTINEFYMKNLDLPEDDARSLRVLRVLDQAAALPDFDDLRQGPPMSFQMAFHFALLVDSLDNGNYSPVWREDVVRAFSTFKASVAEARQHHRETRESKPHYERFGRLLSGSGSDTAEVIRQRHAFLLSQVYPHIRIRPRDLNRSYDILEREVIWNRDRETCQNPNCSRPKRTVAFREATIHHVIEHTAGGPTSLKNGVLICPECHTDRRHLQELAGYFQDYLRRLYPEGSEQPVGIGDEVVTAGGFDLSGDSEDESATDERIAEGRLKIVVDWGALDVDREIQVIAKNTDSESIADLLAELIREFGDSMKEQLTEYPIVRYPLANDPNAFMNRVKGTRYSSIPVPGTNLYFCAHSQRTQKVERLRKLFTRLTLPDGTDFPPGSIEVSIDEKNGPQEREWR